MTEAEVQMRPEPARSPRVASDKDAKQARANWHANAAFYLSLLTAAFSTYQWWNGERESRRNAAVDFSMKYLEDEAVHKGVDALVASTHDDFSYLMVDSAANYVEIMEYTAYLINSGRFDPNYVSRKVLCDVTLAVADVRSSKVGVLQAVKRKEMEKLLRTAPSDVCSG